MAGRLQRGWGKHMKCALTKVFLCWLRGGRGGGMTTELWWWPGEQRSGSEHARARRSEHGGESSWWHPLSGLEGARESEKRLRENEAMPWMSCSPRWPNMRAPSQCMDTRWWPTSAIGRR